MSTQLDSRKQRELAYRLWEERGRPEGRAEEDWFEAERRLSSDQHRDESAAVDEAARESFPASDPPSSHLPDKPPVNVKKRTPVARAAPSMSADSAVSVVIEQGHPCGRHGARDAAARPAQVHGEYLVGFADAVVDDGYQHPLDRRAGREGDRLTADVA